MNLRGYVSSRQFMNERVPQNIQNLVLRDFCKKNDFKFFLSATEYAMQDSYMILYKTISELNKLDGIVMYSLRQLPENHEARETIFEKIIKQEKILYFALENKFISSWDEAHLINEIINVILLQNSTPYKVNLKNLKS